MNLSVAIGMNQHAVVPPVCPPQRFIHDVVVVPTGHFRDQLGTDWADAALLFPEVDQGALSSQGLVHLYAEAFFKVDFPCGIVRVAVSFDFDMSGDGCRRGQAEPIVDRVALFVFCLSEEAPMIVAHLSEVTVGDPPRVLLRVPPPCPAPQGVEDGGIDMDKGFFGRGMLVIIRPPTNFGVELRDQPVCWRLFVVLDDFADVRQKRFHVFL